MCRCGNTEIASQMGKAVSWPRCDRLKTQLKAEEERWNFGLQEKQAEFGVNKKMISKLLVQK